MMTCRICTEKMSHSIDRMESTGKRRAKQKPDRRDYSHRSGFTSSRTFHIAPLGCLGFASSRLRFFRFRFFNLRRVGFGLHHYGSSSF
jgi:hypothetical protein